MFGLKTTKYFNNPDLAEKIFELLPYQPYVKDCKDKDVKKDKHINYLTQAVREIYEDKVEYKMIDVE